MSTQRYTVLEKVDVGGMAEVWKGMATIQGFEKIVAIKRVLPHLSENRKFISMFMDEARLALYLNHANIVQTFDIGTSKDNYFIVMEWIDGVNMKTVMSTAAEQGFRMAREQAAFIAAEVCRGLSHAHQCRDPQGTSLEIVHRDVSPPNVLLSREGEIKLVDFGLARAASQIRNTDPGIVKGKFGYLCPETTTGEPVDHRADIFSAGIILWEMLAGRRLFQGDTNLETVKLVRAAEIPSLQALNPDVEPELEAAVRKALARRPRDRFQSCEEFSHALTRYLFGNKLMVSSYDIAVLVKRILSIKENQASTGSPAPVRVDDVVSQLSDFVSLDELEQMSFVSVSEGMVIDEEATPVSGVDPRRWADEFELGSDDGPPTMFEPDLADRLRESLEASGDEPKAAAPLAETGPPMPQGLESPSSIKKKDVMRFDPPRGARVVKEVDGSEDSSVITGALLGLAGAGLIIGITWFWFS